MGTVAGAGKPDMGTPSRSAGRPSRHTRSPLLQVELDAGSAVPLYRQLYDGLRDAILAGRLAPGARLPSTRTLAADLGVSRNTVLQAFERLRSEGYLRGRRGGGTQVRCTLPDGLLAVRARPGRSVPEATSPAASPVHSTYRLSARGALLAQTGAGFCRPDVSGVAPFQVGLAPVDAFPARLWRRLEARRWRRGEAVRRNADPAGERPLREAIAAYLAAARGAVCRPEQVLVVSGAQQGLNLVAQVLLDPGDPVWLENPGYLGARIAFQVAGARVVPVPLDAEGLDVAAGERLEPRARMAYLTPSHQFPLGVLMSAERRLQLLAWARRAQSWLVEDDYDSEFRYAGAPLPCLQGLEADTSPDTPRVLYVGTFTKTLLPSLRLGYLVVPEPLVDAFRAARAGVDRHPPTAEQGVLADFIGEGHYMRHLRQVRSLAAERQALLLAAVESRLQGMVEVAPDPAGLHLVARLPSGVDDEQAARHAAQHGVTASPLSRSWLGPGPAPTGLLLGYAAFGAGEIEAGVEGLRRALGPLVEGKPPM